MRSGQITGYVLRDCWLDWMGKRVVRNSEEAEIIAKPALRWGRV